MKPKRVQRLEVEFAFGAAGTEKEVQSVIEGEIKQIHLRAGVLDAKMRFR